MTLESNIWGKDHLQSMEPTGDGADSPKQGAASLPGAHLWHHMSVVAISLLLLPLGIVSFLGAHSLGRRSSLLLRFD